MEITENTQFVYVLYFIAMIIAGTGTKDNIMRASISSFSIGTRYQLSNKIKQENLFANVFTMIKQYQRKDGHVYLEINKLCGGMNMNGNKEAQSIDGVPQLNEKKIKIILEHWLSLYSIDLGWIDDFNKMIIQYAKYFTLLKVIRSGVRSRTVRFSPDGTRIVLSSSDTKIRIIDLTGNIIQILQGHNAALIMIRIKKFVGHTHVVLRAQFSPNGHTIVSCSFDQTIRIWNINSGKEIKRLEGHLHWLYDVQFSPDGQKL
ncbi:G-protein beta WD-40 repeats containing protein, partial [Reticulomyxa filosa]